MKNSVLCYLEDSAKKYKEKVAVTDVSGSISFGGLRDLALRTANAILKYQIGIQKPVLVYLPKNKESIAVFMGIVYTRNIYVPTDIKYPQERICKIIDQLEPELIISDRENHDKLLQYGIECKICDMEDINVQEKIISGEELCKKSLLTDLIYIIFTSGTTGVPKGVTISNISVLEYIDWVTNLFGDSDKTVMGSLAPLYFDLSTHEIYTCLAKGATLVMVPERSIPFPASVLKFIKEHHVNYLYWVPSAYANVAALDLLKSIELDEVESMIFGGEVMPISTLNYWKKHLPNVKLIANMYGPTEATVNCTYYLVDASQGHELKNAIPLGKACDIKDVFVLDKNDRLITPAEYGKRGELCVGGTSLSKGYWNNRRATDEVFVQNPLHNKFNDIIYRTGDLVEYDTERRLVYIGRKDLQIKHMGYRIEIAEIESVINATGIVDNLCVLYGAEEKKIVLAYSAKEELGERELIGRLGKVLPKYMIPAKYIYIKEMPLTDSGKVDRRKIENLYTKSLSR